MARKSTKQLEIEGIEEYMETRGTVDAILREINEAVENSWHAGTPTMGAAYSWKDIAHKLQTALSQIQITAELESR